MLAAIVARRLRRRPVAGPARLPAVARRRHDSAHLMERMDDERGSSLRVLTLILALAPARRVICRRRAGRPEVGAARAAGGGREAEAEDVLLRRQSGRSGSSAARTTAPAPPPLAEGGFMSMKRAPAGRRQATARGRRARRQARAHRRLRRAARLRGHHRSRSSCWCRSSAPASTCRRRPPTRSSTSRRRRASTVAGQFDPVWVTGTHEDRDGVHGACRRRLHAGGRECRSAPRPVKNSTWEQGASEAFAMGARSQPPPWAGVVYCKP